MGAAPVLIMLAAVGVDYGWHPDGTTSPQGDNIEYIVQIAPDQLQQLKSIGEITSTIDPAVQGRVARIVVKVGTGPLPQDAGRAAPPALSVQNSGRSDSSFADAADNVDIPRPQISGTVAPVQLAGSPRGLSAGPQNESLLKPDPQGFAMPDSVAGAGQSALDQVRSGVNNAGTQLEAQAKSAIDSIPNATKQTASDLLNRAGDTVRNTINNSLAPNSNGSAATPFNGTPNNSSFQFNPETPAAGRDNQWADLSGRSGATAGVPSTDPADANALRNTAWANGATATQPVADPRVTTNPPATTDPRTFGTTANTPGLGGPNLPSNNLNANHSPVTPAKTPSDPGWSGYGTSSTFGSAPAGVSLPNQSASGYHPGNVAANPAPAIGNNGYPATGGVGAGGYANATPSTSNAGSMDTGFYGNSAQTPYAQIANNWNNASVQPGTNTTNPNLTTNSANSAAWNTPYASTANLPSTSPVASNSTAMEQMLAEQREQLKSMQSKMNSLEQRDKAQTNLVHLGDGQIHSASDWSTSAQARAERERQMAASASQAPTTGQTNQPQRLDAPKFFHFILLLSLVGNAYLIFETNNLRRKFKNMISSVRTSKVGTQPVTS